MAMEILLSLVAFITISIGTPFDDIDNERGEPIYDPRELTAPVNPFKKKDQSRKMIESLDIASCVWRDLDRPSRAPFLCIVP